MSAADAAQSSDKVWCRVAFGRSAGYAFPGGLVSLHYPAINAQTGFDAAAGRTTVDHATATTRYPQSSEGERADAHCVCTRQTNANPTVMVWLVA